MIKLPLKHLEGWLQISQNATSQAQLSNALKNVGNEVSVVASTCRIFALPYAKNSEAVENMASPMSNGELPESILSMFHKGWPLLTIAAAQWGDDEVSP
jgi:hypothetical protein